MTISSENAFLTFPGHRRSGTVESTIRLTEFDQRHYLKLIRTRGETIRQVVTELRQSLRLESAVDAGCGVGFFAQILQECGVNVCGFDGRGENIAEARRRFPAIAFERGDIESAEILKLGTFDLTLCFGLVYHPGKSDAGDPAPARADEEGLLLESMCIRGGGAGMVLREEPAAADQSLTDIALYLSESCLVKMLYRAGFAEVYRVAELPDHDDFRETAEHARVVERYCLRRWSRSACRAWWKWQSRAMGATRGRNRHLVRPVGEIDT